MKTSDGFIQTLRQNLTTVILALSVSACGQAPKVETLSPTQAQSVALIKLALRGQALAQFGSVPNFPADLSIHFVATPADLPADNCSCVAFMQPGGDIWVSMVDEYGQTPTQTITRSPLAHELIHVLYGDPQHLRSELWDVLLWTTYNHLNGTSYNATNAY